MTTTRIYCGECMEEHEYGLHPIEAPRRVRVESTYEDAEDDDDTTKVEHDVYVRDPQDDESTDAYDEYLRDALYPLTGTGRTDDIGSCYTITSIDGLEPAINLEWID